MTLFKVLAKQLEKININRAIAQEYSHENVGNILRVYAELSQQALSQNSELFEAVRQVLAHAKRYPHPLYEEDVRALEAALAAESTSLSSLPEEHSVTTLSR